MLVTITYSDDANATFEQALGEFMVQSAWLQTVGKEYGVGAGTHVSISLPDTAPTSIDDTTIQSNILALIQAGTAPDPAADGGISSATYMAFFPSSTAITAGGSTLCQISGGGYHGETTATVNGHTISYSVVSECQPGLPVQPPQDITWAASHEFIESATDPYPNSSPGYAIFDTNQPWALIGGEVGDLCTYVLPQWTEGSYTALQRVYSNASAKAGGSPCIPAPATYYGHDDRVVHGAGGGLVADGRGPAHHGLRAADGLARNLHAAERADREAHGRMARGDAASVVRGHPGDVVRERDRLHGGHGRHLHALSGAQARSNARTSAASTPSIAIAPASLV